MGEITLLSANTRGLADKVKRKDVFSYLRNKCYNIYCIQDTHFVKENENMLRNEWGFDCYFNSFKPNSRGVAILINNNFNFKINGEKRDLTGNFLALDIEIEDSKITLINVYGPNQDNPTFFNIITETIDEFENPNIIICGDFNLVINPDIDYDNNYKNINNPKAREKLLEIIDNYALVDIFREHHENTRRYTWRKPTPIKQARLDFFLFLKVCYQVRTVQV